MAEFLERTFGALQTLVGSGDHLDMPSSLVQAPKCRWSNLRDFLQRMSTVCTKYDEETLINMELAIIKKDLADPRVKSSYIKECLVKAIYVDMLGYSPQVVYINCIKLTQQGSLHEKCLGYLCASLFFHEQHEFSVLLINTVQKDLTSSNVLEICLALRSACDFATEEMLMTVLPNVEKLAKHSKDVVRKKVAMVVLNFYKKFPSLMADCEYLVEVLLSDSDPGVVAVALQIYEVLAAREPEKYVCLVPTLIEIQRQILSRKLSEDFEHHGMSAPWIQIRLVRLVRGLVSVDRTCCDLVADIVFETMEVTNLNNNSAFMVTYECMMTSVLLYTNARVFQRMLTLISKFLKSQNNNLKYAGLNVLANVVQVMQPAFVAEYQTTMIEFLCHPDASLRRKTIDLLFKMTNSSNVELICAKMTEYLSTTDDDYLKAELVRRILEVTEQYSPDLLWSLQTIHDLYLKGGRWIEPQLVFRFLDALKKGSGDADLDEETRQQVLQLFFANTRNAQSPDGLVQATAWILGEFAFDNGEVPPAMALDELVHMSRTHWNCEHVLFWILQAIIKLVLRSGITESVVLMLTQHPAPKSVEILQLVNELRAIVENYSCFQSAAAAATTLTAEEPDFTLSFLDSFVAESLKAGASPYQTQNNNFLCDLLNNVSII